MADRNLGLVLAAAAVMAVASCGPASAQKLKHNSPSGIGALIERLQRQDTAALDQASPPRAPGQDARLSFGRVDDGSNRPIDPSQESPTIPAVGLNLNLDF